MTRALSWGRLLVVAALTAAGVGAGHVAEYAALAPDDHRRRELLAHTGHGYLPFAGRAAGFIGVLVLAAVFLASAARTVNGDDGRRPDLRWAATLPVAQSFAFVALELIERLIAHAALGDLVAVILVGVPIQIVVGLLGRSLLGALCRAGERVGVAARRIRRRRRPAGVAWRSTKPAAVWPPAPRLLAGPRGPPALRWTRSV